MSRERRTIVGLAVIALAFSFAFPPFLRESTGGGEYYNGHYLIIEPQGRNPRIYWDYMGLQLGMILLIAGVAWFVVGPKKEE